MVQTAWQYNKKYIASQELGFTKLESSFFFESYTVGLIILILIYHKSWVASFVPFNSFTTKGTKKHCWNHLYFLQERKLICPVLSLEHPFRAVGNVEKYGIFFSKHLSQQYRREALNFFLVKKMTPCFQDASFTANLVFWISIF